MKLASLTIFALGLVELMPVAQAQAVQEAKLVPSGAQANDDFGYRVALFVDRAAVSKLAPPNDESVFMYRANGASWTQEQKLNNPSGLSSKEFGRAISLSGSALVVGAPSEGAPTATGKAYVFRRTGTVWSLEATLAPADGAVNDRFGDSVSIDNDVIIVSSQGHRIAGQLLGAVYIYRRQGAAWTLEQKIVGPPFDVNLGLSHYGFPVAVRGGVAVVSADYTSTDNSPGRAYVYRNSGTTWSQEAVLTGSDSAGDGAFGDSVATDGTFIAVGDPNDNGAALEAGAVYVFRNAPGWAQEAKLEPSTLTPASLVLAHFGRGQRLSVDTNVIVVGNENTNRCHPGNTSGDARVFRFDGTRWILEDYLCSADISTSDLYGYATCVNNEKVIIGALDETVTGAAYVFRLDKDTDGDGLPDTWETNGVPIPGGVTRYVLPGANPLHKNLYVEVDAMDEPGLAPSAAVLAECVAVFAGAPTPNPDGTTGITLRLDRDQVDITPGHFSNVWPDYDSKKSFGTSTERADANAVNILAAKKVAYRYCLFARSYGTNNSSGFSESPGNDSAITLGLWSTSGGTDNQKIGTFLHEFGHALGLQHGGNQVDPNTNNDLRYNYKPNYYSVMNYTWQVPYSWMAPFSWPKSYSRGLLATLDEANLNEPAGLGAPFMLPLRLYWVPFNTERDPLLPPHIVYANVGPGFAVDWNNNGTINAFPGSPIHRDVNRIDSASFPDDTLTDHDDWSNLTFGFRYFPNFADGVHTSDTGAGEITFQEFTALNALPSPIVGAYCTGKLHSGGCVPPIIWSGLPSNSSPSPFLVQATQLKPNVTAFMYYGTQARETPFQGGTLCVGGTIKRLPAQNSGGSGACGGSIQFDFNPLIQSGTQPILAVGATVFCQAQFRDPADPAGFGIGYTSAVQFTIQP